GDPFGDLAEPVLQVRHLRRGDPDERRMAANGADLEPSAAGQRQRDVAHCRELEPAREDGGGGKACEKGKAQAPARNGPEHRWSLPCEARSLRYGARQCIPCRGAKLRGWRVGGLEGERGSA